MTARAADRAADGPGAVPPCAAVLATAPTPGAIAIILLAGGVAPVLAALTGRDDWPVGRCRLVSLGDIDEGLAARLAPDCAELMPHGGPRVVQLLAARLRALGVPFVDTGALPPAQAWPEARDANEATMLHALARAHSPLAIDALLDPDRAPPRVDRLVDPPLVVLAGPPNVGKSTLSNTLLGRSMSIALDQPGTTRDTTAGLLELAGLVVRWYDTPGLRPTDDLVERRAIELARALMLRCDLLVAMTDATHDWPDLPRAPDLRIASRADVAPRDDADVNVSALAGTGVEEMVRAMRDRLLGEARRPRGLA